MPDVKTTVIVLVGIYAIVIDGFLVGGMDIVEIVLTQETEVAEALHLHLQVFEELLPNVVGMMPMRVELLQIVY